MKLPPSPPKGVEERLTDLHPEGLNDLLFGDQSNHDENTAQEHSSLFLGGEGTLQMTFVNELCVQEKLAEGLSSIVGAGQGGGAVFHHNLLSNGALLQGEKPRNVPLGHPARDVWDRKQRKISFQFPHTPIQPPNLVIGKQEAHPPPVTPPESEAIEVEGAASAGSGAEVPAVLRLLLPVITLSVVGWLGYEGAQQVRQADQRLTSELLKVTSPTVDWTDFDLPNPAGAKVRLSKLAHGKTVIINFWATWCPPCVEEIPSLTKLYDKIKDDPRFEFIAVSADESMEEIADFFDGEAPPFPVVLDAGGEVAAKYGTSKFPETFILQDERLIGHIIGPRDWSAWFAFAWLDEIAN